MMKNFLPHTPLSRVHRHPRALSQEVSTTVMGRNNKILRRLEGILRK